MRNLAQISYTCGMKMRGAQEMARKRLAGMSEEEKSAHGKVMADARQAATTPEQRSAAAKKAAVARWAKKKAAKTKKK
jgi:hypothetical protein